MGFGKAFGLGLVVYIILNFVLNLVLALVPGIIEIGDYFGGISTAPITFIASFFAISGTGFTAATEAILIGLLGGVGAILSDQVLYGILVILAAILPGLVTAIIVGKLSDSPGKGFGATVLIYVIAAVLILVFMFIEPAQVALYLGSVVGYIMVIALMPGVTDAVVGVLSLILILVYGGLFSGMFWGSISAVLAKES